METDFGNDEILCFQRINNHKDEFKVNKKIIPINKWQLFVGPPNKSCFNIGKYQYTLLFAKIDKEVAQNCGENITLSILPKNLNQANHCVVAMTEETKFKMESIRKFSERLDAHNAKNFDYLSHFRRSKTLPGKSRKNSVNEDTLVDYNNQVE